MFPIKGEVEDIERSKGRTEVVVDEGINTVSYALDESLIDFGTAVDEKDFERAVDILEPLELTPGSMPAYVTSLSAFPLSTTSQAYNTAYLYYRYKYTRAQRSGVRGLRDGSAVAAAEHAGAGVRSAEYRGEV